MPTGPLCRCRGDGVRGSSVRQANAGRVGQAARPVWAPAPSDQDSLRRLPVRRPGGRHPATAGTTFNFLGFTHVWGESRKGKNVVRQITAKDRYARALASVTEWCRRNLHRPFREQHSHLSQVIRGHCAYYGITGNGRRIRWFHHQLVRIWRKWLAPMRSPLQSAVAPLPSHARSAPVAASLDRPPVHCRLSEPGARRAGCGESARPGL